MKLEERWLSSHEVRIKVNERKMIKVRMRRENRYIKMKVKETEWRKVGGYAEVRDIRDMRERLEM